MTRALLALALVACSPPSPVIELRLSGGPAQECPSQDCGEVAITCSMYMGLRILDPAVRKTPFVSDCLRVPEGMRNACALRRVELPAYELPYRDLEVQIALYPESMVTFPQVEGVPALPVCPTNATFDAAFGFPITPGEDVPAMGGRGYYRAGDEVISIELGCTSMDLLSCGGTEDVDIIATVDDFETRLGVERDVAGGLSVEVGEPEPSGGRYVLRSSNTTPMELTAPGLSWTGRVDARFQRFACLTVLDSEPQGTITVTCKEASVTETSIDLSGRDGGVRMTRATLEDDILDAIGLDDFPLEGMTIGIVVDSGAPIAGQVVSAIDAETGDPVVIEYLNADRSGVGGAATSASGIFVAREAAFGTRFDTQRMTPPSSAFEYGGRIEGKATIVVLDLNNTIQPGGDD